MLQKEKKKLRTQPDNDQAVPWQSNTSPQQPPVRKLCRKLRWVQDFPHQHWELHKLASTLSHATVAWKEIFVPLNSTAQNGKLFFVAQRQTPNIFSLFLTNTHSFGHEMQQLGFRSPGKESDTFISNFIACLWYKNPTSTNSYSEQKTKWFICKQLHTAFIMCSTKCTQFGWDMVCISCQDLI